MANKNLPKYKNPPPPPPKTDDGKKWVEYHFADKKREQRKNASVVSQLKFWVIFLAVACLYLTYFYIFRCR